MTKKVRLNLVGSLAVLCVGAALVPALAWGQAFATEPVLGGSKTVESGGAGGAQSQGANSQLEHCDESIGTMAVDEDQSAPWYGELSQYKLGSTIPVLRLLIQQSNCFVVVERGQRHEEHHGGAALQQSGETREGSNFGKGQMAAADYTMSPSITFSQKGTGGAGAALGAFGGILGRAAGAIAGGVKTNEASTALLLIDNRSSVQLAAATGAQRTWTSASSAVCSEAGEEAQQAGTRTHRRGRSLPRLSWILTTSWSGWCATTRRKASKAVWAQVGALVYKVDRRQPQKT